eukprot:6581252-Pyramimonas_sp.AAC.3
MGRIVKSLRLWHASGPLACARSHAKCALSTRAVHCATSLPPPQGPSPVSPGLSAAPPPTERAAGRTSTCRCTGPPWPRG